MTNSKQDSGAKYSVGILYAGLDLLFLVLVGFLPFFLSMGLGFLATWIVFARWRLFRKLVALSAAMTAFALHPFFVMSIFEKWSTRIRFGQHEGIASFLDDLTPYTGAFLLRAAYFAMLTAVIWLAPKLFERRTSGTKQP